MYFSTKNDTQAEIDECKAFCDAERESQEALLAAGMERCKQFLNSKILVKKAELVKPLAGGPKGKRVSSYVMLNKKHKTQNPWDSSHKVILMLYHCIHYNQCSRLLLIDTVLTQIIYFYLSVGGGTGITFSAGTTIIPL
jgi:hypothetical protein